ncbi:MAG: hypothetical protein JXR63_13880 [Spirochaetales bacterium]|nr:hypothetical protein [Spirochaetales bacterium]
MDLNYFSVLAFSWAGIGIISRILMFFLGDRWAKWELNRAYSEKRPKWIIFVAVFFLILVVVTWVQVGITDIRGSWIIAVLLSLVLIKVSTWVFNYNSFRNFAEVMLKDRKKMRILNIFVLVLSIAMILMGILLY